MKSLVLVLLSVLFVSCMAQKTVKFSIDTKQYLLDIPSGYRLVKSKDYHQHIEYKFQYPDSSIIYITDDIESGGAINTDKVKKYGNNIFIKILTSDTLDISGVEGKKYWREIKRNNVVAGYINAPLSKEKQYQDVLKTLRLKD